MPTRGHLPVIIRRLRLMAALSMLTALAAIATIMSGDSGGRGRALIAAAIMLGCLALLGMALPALFHVRRKKEQNDPRP